MKKVFFLYCFTIASLFCKAQLNAEQKEIRQIFFNFLKFYQKNEKKFNAFELYKGTGKESGPPYKIQWKEVEKYFSYLRKNVPFVGEAYINAEKQHFKNAANDFKKYPEEEIPMGFDYDRWAGGQESIVYTYKWYTSSQNKYIVIITGNKALLKIGGELWDGATEEDRAWNIVPFVKEKGRWKMADNIYPAGVDEIEEKNNKAL